MNAFSYKAKSRRIMHQFVIMPSKKIVHISKQIIIIKLTIGLHLFINNNCAHAESPTFISNIACMRILVQSASSSKKRTAITQDIKIKESIF